MNKIKYALFAAFIAASIVVIGNTGQEAQAAAQSTMCTLKPLTLDKYAKSFVVDGNMVTAKFTLSGDKDCKFDMSLFAFEAPAADAMPVKDQRLYSYDSATFGPGTHTLSISMPQCYYQLDIVTGRPIEALIGARANDVINLNNSVNQGRIGGAGNYNAHVHDAKIGGNRPCMKPVTPVVDPPPAVDVKPEEPVTEEPVAEEPAESPANLPKTGASAAVLSLGAIGASGKKLFRSRQGLKATLLSRK